MRVSSSIAHQQSVRINAKESQRSSREAGQSDPLLVASGDLNGEVLNLKVIFELCSTSALGIKLI